MPSFEETVEAIKADWSAGEKNFNIECERLPEGMQVMCTMGNPAGEDFKLLIDAPGGLSGTNKGPSPLLVILSSIGACIIAVTNFWARIMGIKIEEMKVFSRGHINLGALFGIDDSKLPGYDKLEPVIRIKADAPEEKINELMDKVFSHCPVITNFGGASKIQPKVQIRK
ncbi:MAG: OsmC family peroxiredoxin [Promethearchaeota archaeon]|nr:MAG: OsmC family peroxiredoxin [Candidatus Lokiarchaeota archaeon]